MKVRPEKVKPVKALTCEGLGNNEFCSFSSAGSNE